MKKEASVSYDLDISDLLVMLGLAFLAGAVWVALGWVGMLGFVGAVLLVVGLAMARREPAKRDKRA